MTLEPLSFEVTADSATYQAGGVTKFNFSGKADNITFYSGEVGKRYEFANRVSANGIPQLRFSTALNAGVQPNSLRLLVSNNFAGGVNGASDPSLITTATWTDISDRAIWATNATAVSSGAIDLSDFAATGKPVYIAFKYSAVAGSVQNKWTITGLSLKNVLPDGTSYMIDTMPALTTVMNYSYTTSLPGWSSKTIANTYNWSLSTASMVITGAATAGAATNSAEAWAITGPVDLKKVTPDVGVVVKNMSSFVPSWSYSYASTGNYQATFVASNANADGQKSIGKKLTINVR
jgi:hypothetical protein